MRVLALAAVVLLSACPTTEEPEPLDPNAPKYYSDIQPILQTHCVRCHYADGLGLGDFTDPDVVVGLAGAIVGEVEAGRMPPPASDPECRDYAGSAQLVLPEADKAVFREWRDGGAQLGDPADAVEGNFVETELADADTDFLMLEPYTPVYDDPALPGNEYRCFVLENTAPQTFFITGLSPIIDAQEIAHHIVVSRIDANDGDIPAHDPAEGFECADFNILSGLLGAWAPGMLPIEMPEGYGMRVSPDQNIIMQMHYFDSNPGTDYADQSGYAFRTEPEVDKEMLMIPIGSFDWTIPAGDDSFSHHESYSPTGLGFPVDVDIFGVFPHMHVLGKAWDYWVEHEGGKETCLSQSDVYDFNNQMTYMWNDKVRVGADDQLHFECTWNNSTSNPDRVVDPPQDTSWGEGTDSEMCFFFTYGAAASD
ncbi:MAG: hypothetical protein GY898_28880 [Proteobacteria bacterium]|nr:hypothetical protein [Pseudomonadota bacterium]